MKGEVDLLLHVIHGEKPALDLVVVQYLLADSLHLLGQQFRFEVFRLSFDFRHESSLFFGILQERIHVAPYQVVLLNALLFSVWHIGYILGGVDGASGGTVICKNCKVGVFPNEMGRLTRSLCFQKRVGEQKRSRFQKGTGPFGWRLLGGRS